MQSECRNRLSETIENLVMSNASTAGGFSAAYLLTACSEAPQVNGRSCSQSVQLRLASTAKSSAAGCHQALTQTLVSLTAELTAVILCVATCRNNPASPHYCR
jgi:hypothetical protein